jgi:hypothetical protein
MVGFISFGQCCAMFSLTGKKGVDKQTKNLYYKKELD